MVVIPVITGVGYYGSMVGFYMWGNNIGGSDQSPELLNISTIES